MRELVFALEFKGSGAPVPGSDTRLAASTSASSQTLRTVLKADGIQSTIESAGGEPATFQSTVDIVGEGQFVESGTIRYGSVGSVTFKTIGHGTMGPSPDPKLQRGAVMWEVTGGDGTFRGAQGIITSNFTFNSAGEVVDDQFARIFI